VYRWRGEGAWQQASWLKVAFLVVRWWECNVGKMYMLKLRDLEEKCHVELGLPSTSILVKIASYGTPLKHLECL
jgi:hypothetical protein